MPRATRLFVHGGLAVAAVWSVLHQTWIGLLQAAVILAVLAVVVRMLRGRDADLRALRRAVAREQVLSELGTELITATDEAEVQRLAVRAAGTLLADVPGARATILGVDADGFTVTVAAGDRADILPGQRLPATEKSSAVIKQLLAGEIVVVHDLTSLGYPKMDAALERAFTLMPLMAGGRFFGVLSVSAHGELPAEVCQSLPALRTQVALALISVALTGELTERALRDPLTGLGNRAMLHERLGGALARARRSGRPVGALLLDLNGFKQVNDRHGHNVGDELLQVVADRLHECVRTEDVVARLGGDEFVVIAEDLGSARDATVVAERIVASLGEAIPVGAQRLRTPASIGIAISHAGVTDPAELLRLAGTAMCAAKRRGGGGFHLHGAPEPALTG